MVRSIVNDYVKGTAVSPDFIECAFRIHITHNNTYTIVVIDQTSALRVNIAANDFFRIGEIPCPYLKRTTILHANLEQTQRIILVWQEYSVINREIGCPLVACFSGPVSV